MLKGFVAVLASAAALTLEKPFDLNEWTASGEFMAGNDVFMLGTKQGDVASLWTQQPIQWPEWTFNVVMRTFAGASDPGNSGLAIFHTSQVLGDGALHGASEYYDGLAVTVDSMGWDEHGQYPDEEKGAVRGHLSDGTTPFSSTPVEQSFSLCRIPYRATQGPINIKIGYGRGVFVVEVNKQKCFSSDRIVLPEGFFGISANTGLSDDTFALDRVELTAGLDQDLERHFSASELSEPLVQAESGSSSSDLSSEEKAGAGSYAGSGSGARLPPGDGGRPVAEAPKVDISPVVAAVSALSARFDQIQNQLDTSHTNLKEALALGGGAGADNLDKVLELVETINRIGQRVENLESFIQRKNDEQLQNVHSKIDSKVDQLGQKFQAREVVAASPSFWGPVAVLLVGQAVVYIGYMSWVARQAKGKLL